MKKFLLVLFILVGFSSCAWTTKQVDYAKACQEDVACLAEAKRDAELAKTIVGMAYPIAGAPVGAAVLAIVLWFRGRKIKEKS